MSAKSAPTSIASSKATASMLSLTTRIVSCIPSPTKRSRRIESASWGRPSPGRLRMKKAAEKYSILSEVSSRGRSPLTVSLRHERKRVSSAKRPSTLPWRSPSSSQMQNVAPSRMRSCSAIAQDPPTTRLRERLDDDLVHVHVRRPGDGEEDALGDVLRLHRLDPLVDGARLLLVAAEPDEGEVRLDEPGIHRRDVDRPAEEVLAQRIREPAHGELRRDVEGPVRVCLASGDGAEVDDVAAV